MACRNSRRTRSRGRRRRWYIGRRRRGGLCECLASPLHPSCADQARSPLKLIHPRRQRGYLRRKSVYLILRACHSAYTSPTARFGQETLTPRYLTCYLYFMALDCYPAPVRCVNCSERGTAALLVARRVPEGIQLAQHRLLVGTKPLHEFGIGQRGLLRARAHGLQDT